MKKLLLLFVALSLILPASGYAYGKRGGHGDYSSHGYSGKHLNSKFFTKIHFIFANKDALELSEDQIKSIKNIKYDVKRAMVEADSVKDLAMLDVYQELHETAPVAEVRF